MIVVSYVTIRFIVILDFILSIFITDHHGFKEEHFWNDHDIIHDHLPMCEHDESAQHEKDMDEEDIEDEFSQCTICIWNN